MTKDDIIRIAREAGFRSVMMLHIYGNKESALCDSEIEELRQIETFANLVAVAARNMTFTKSHWTAYEQSIAATEREECAKVCESLSMQQDRDVRDECAAAIRARGSA